MHIPLNCAFGCEIGIESPCKRGKLCLLNIPRHRSPSIRSFCPHRWIYTTAPALIPAQEHWVCSHNREPPSLPFHLYCGTYSKKPRFAECRQDKVPTHPLLLLSLYNSERLVLKEKTSNTFYPMCSRFLTPLLFSCTT